MFWKPAETSCSCLTAIGVGAAVSAEVKCWVAGQDSFGGRWLLSTCSDASACSAAKHAFTSLQRDGLSRRVLLFGGTHGCGVRQRTGGRNARADVPSRKGLSLGRNVTIMPASIGVAQNKTRQDKTRQDKTRQDKTRQDKARQRNATQRNATQRNATQHNTP